MNDAPHDQPDFPYRMYTADAKRWTKSLKAYARANRRQPTPAEDQLWQALRGAQLGARFRRQHAIRHFFFHFVCLAAGLIVEVDGEVHATQADYDAGRTQELQEYGFWVLRFTNTEVL